MNLSKKYLAAFLAVMLCIFFAQLVLSFQNFKVGDDIFFSLTTHEESLPLASRLTIAFHSTVKQYVGGQNDRFIGSLVSFSLASLTPFWTAFWKSVMLPVLVFFIFKVATFGRKASKSPLFFLLTYLLLWLPSYPIGDVYMYNAAVGNYLFNFILFFAYLWAIIVMFTQSKARSFTGKTLTLWAAGLFILGALAGDSNENSSFALIALSGLFILAGWFGRKRFFTPLSGLKRIPFPFCFGFLGNLAGLLVMVLSPSFTNRLSVSLTNNSDGHRWHTFFRFFFVRYPLHLAPILLVLVIVCIVARFITHLAGEKTTFQRSSVLGALFFITLAVISNLSLAFGSVIISRALAITALLLVTAALILLAGWQAPEGQKKTFLIILASLTALLWAGTFGLAFHRSHILHKEWIARDAQLRSASTQNQKGAITIPLYTQFPLQLGLYVRRTDFTVVGGRDLMYLEGVYGLKKGQLQWAAPKNPREARLLKKAEQFKHEGKEKS